MRKPRDIDFDVVGVGLGPFNLSAAALLEPVRQLKARFFEREKEFQWHPGLLFPDSTIQVSFLKDLVTLADPTSAYSFLAFLFASRRLYRFINANFTRVSRVEFNQYFRWVANRLSSLEFGSEVQAVSFQEDSFLVSVGNRQVRAGNIILGTGLHPSIPECAAAYVGDTATRTVLHASKFLQWQPLTRDKRVAVVGGGQTGAELIHYLLSTPQRLPGKLLWISKRSNFLPLDESPFTNELFTPNYSDYFYGLSSKDRLSILAEQKLASDGINNSLLEKIYQLLYQAEFLSGQGRCCSLYPGCELVSLKASPRGGWTLTLREGVSSSRFSIDADIVILATGFAYKFLPALEPIRHLLPYGDHGFTVRDDYSLEWNGSGSGKIYIQNGAKQYRGIADPNLSLMAWRSARIINSLAGTSIYDVAENNSVFDLAAAESAERMMEEDDYESTGHFPKVERAVVAVGPRRVVGP